MDTRRAAVDWGIGAILWVLALVAVGPLVGESPLATAAESLIDATPGGLMSLAIDRLGFTAKPVAVVGTAALAVVAAVGVGVLLATAARSETGSPTALADRLRPAVDGGVVALTGAALLWSADGSSLSWALATGLALLPVAALRWLRTWRMPAENSRRQLLREVGTALGAAGGVAVLVGTFAGERTGTEPGADLDMVAEKRDVGETTPTGRGAAVTDDGTVTPGSSGQSELDTVRETEGVTVSAARTREPFTFDFEGMPRRVGDADSHYVVDKTITKPTPNADEWSLSIEGAIEEPDELDYGDLLDHPEARDLPLTMVCISNSVGGGLIATTTWRVIPLRALLSEVGVRSEAGDVVTHALDGYSEALPWSVVRERPDISIAFGMDGLTLPVEHGFPARLQVPGRYGMKSTKWVDRIELATEDHESYYEQRGWDEEAVINTLSYLRTAQRRGDRVAVGGVAFAGNRGIQRVDVSVDGGETWGEADLEDAPGEFAWRRWRRVVDEPETGSMELVTRALDGEGALQTEDRTDPAPAGATGWHTVEISL